MGVWKCKDSILIKVNVVNGPQFHSILGCRVIIRLCLVKMTDNDEILKPNTSGTEVYSTSGQDDLPTMDNLVIKFLICSVKQLENWMDATG